VNPLRDQKRVCVDLPVLGPHLITLAPSPQVFYAKLKEGDGDDIRYVPGVLWGLHASGVRNKELVRRCA
jgi:hypothetical protein